MRRSERGVGAAPAVVFRKHGIGRPKVAVREQYDPRP